MEKYEPYWDGDPDDWTIAESEHYIIKGEWEEAVLYRKDDGTRITCVGDFYGDPETGLIDREERFCIVAGCGVIIYRLQEPFQEYMYDTKTPQWYEFNRDPGEIEWVSKVKQLDDTNIEVIDEDGSTRIMHVE